LPKRFWCGSIHPWKERDYEKVLFEIVKARNKLSILRRFRVQMEIPKRLGLPARHNGSGVRKTKEGGIDQQQRSRGKGEEDVNKRALAFMPAASPP